MQFDKMDKMNSKALIKKSSKAFHKILLTSLHACERMKMQIYVRLKMYIVFYKKLRKLAILSKNWSLAT